MGFHQYNTNFTLEPRTALNKNVSRGLGNQVTVEFNLLYRFHCAISQKDEAYTEQFMWETWQQMNADQAKQNGSASKGPDLKKKDWESWVRNMPLQDFGKLGREMNKEAKKDPWLVEFGLRDDPNHTFRRNTVTGLFEDERMIEQLHKAMEDPICEIIPNSHVGKLQLKLYSEFWAKECSSLPQECRDHGHPSGSKMVSRVSKRQSTITDNVYATGRSVPSMTSEISLA